LEENTMPAPSPQDQLSHLMSGYWYIQDLHVAAKLKLTDLRLATRFFQ
jgi:hypothetical protein